MLGEQVLKACKSRGMTLARACGAAGLNYSTLHSQIRNQREIPFTSIDKLSSALNLPVGYFSQTKPSLAIEPAEAATAVQAEAARALSDLITKQVAAMADWGYQIGTDDVLDWLLVNDSRLVNYDWLIDRIDLFYPVRPGETMVRPYRIGSKSLSAKYFQLCGTDDYLEVVGKFDKDILAEVVTAHSEVAGRRYSISDRAIDQQVDGARIRGTYRRLLAPVTGEDGERYTLVFSKLTQFSGG